MPTIFGSTTFVSPGVFVSEIDQSVLPQAIQQIGGAVVGLSEKGPAMVPTKVGGFEDYASRFGNLNVDYEAPYGVYTHLLNANNITFVRVLGHTDDQSDVKAGMSLNPYGLISLVVSSSSENQSMSFARLYTSGALNVQPDYTGPATGSHDGEFNVYGTSPDGTNINITASINPSAANFYRNVLNYDVKKLETKGHFVSVDDGALLDLGNQTAIRTVASASYAKNEALSAITNLENNFTSGSTPTIISQNFTGTEYNLIKFHTIGHGLATAREIKVAVTNIRPSTFENVSRFGSFDIVIRKFSDTDKNPVVLETFTNVNLDKESSNYIVKRIGNRTVEFDTNLRKFTFAGEYENKSQFIKVEIVNDDHPDEALPWGYKGYSHMSGGVPTWLGDTGTATNNSGSTELQMPLTRKLYDYQGNFVRGTHWGIALGNQMTGSYLPHQTAGYAVGTGRYTYNTGSYNVLLQRAAISGRLEYPSTSGNNAFVTGSNFSLQYISASGGGSVITGTLTPQRLKNLIYVPGGWGESSHPSTGSGLEYDYAGNVTGFGIPTQLSRFTLAFEGGWDGFNRSQDDPFLNIKTDNSTAATIESISTKRGIDTLANPDEVDINLLAIPGVVNTNVVDHARDVVGDRGDVFYVMDIPGGNVNDAIVKLDNRGIDDNFTGCYFPSLMFDDPVNNRRISIPASVGVLGALAYNDRVAQPWFAPAGLNRGGLGRFRVTRARIRLTAEDRNRLYEARINPIATFSGQGVSIFGQKTLQAAPSALDRINVRRLLLAIRKTIASAAAFLVFEPNDETTRTALKRLIEPILESVQVNRGIQEFKVVVDDSVNTPESIDRNILKGLVFIKPTRAVEFIVLPFIVTRTGAEFSVESVASSI